MKKNSSGCKSPKARMKATRATNVTVGIDLGDKTSRYCMLDENGEVSRESSVATTKKADAGLRNHEAMSCGDRSGDPFSVGKPAAAELRT